MTKSETEFPVKGSETTLLDSSRLRVKILLKALLVDTRVGTQIIPNIHIYVCVCVNNVKQCKI